MRRCLDLILSLDVLGGPNRKKTSWKSRLVTFFLCSTDESSKLILLKHPEAPQTEKRSAWSSSEESTLFQNDYSPNKINKEYVSNLIQLCFNLKKLVMISNINQLEIDQNRVNAAIKST